MGSLNTENYNSNGFYSYLQKNDLVYTYEINHTKSVRHQKERLKMQRIAQLLRSIKTIFNIEQFSPLQSKHFS